MIKLQHFHHATLPITDKERADDFYVNKLGFTMLPRPTLAFGGTWLQFGDIQVHLVIVDEEEMRLHTQGYSASKHLAFAVDDYEETRKALEAAGLQYRENIAGTNLQFFVSDPDGNSIEFIKPGPPYKGETADSAEKEKVSS